MSAEWPETRDELIARFCDPDHNDHIWIEDRVEFEKFVDLALTQTDPSYRYAFSDNPERQSTITVERLCHLIYDCDFFMSAFTGWIDREGFFYGCKYACHERLLELMDMNSIEQEQAGWVKLSRRQAHARFMPNAAQMATINRICEELEGINKGDSADAMPGATLDLKKLADLPKLP